jgi:hypothetical protein
MRLTPNGRLEKRTSRQTYRSQDSFGIQHCFGVNSHDIPIFLGELQMKPFLLACAAAIVVAAVAAVVLNRVQQPVEQAFATTGVRL